MDDIGGAGAVAARLCGAATCHENGIDYILCGDYYIPEWQIPQNDCPIGHYG